MYKQTKQYMLKKFPQTVLVLYSSLGAWVLLNELLKENPSQDAVIVAMFLLVVSVSTLVLTHLARTNGFVRRSDEHK